MNKFIKEFKDMMSYPKMSIALVLLVLLIIAQIFVNVLNFMASLSLGQIFVKHKILGSIVFYFLLNYVMGFITSLIMMVVPDLTTKLDNIENEITSVKQMVNTIANPMIVYFLIMLLLQIFMAVVYFVISEWRTESSLRWP